MQRLTRSQLKRYGVAILTVLLALLLTQSLWLMHRFSAYPLFFAAVMVSSWYGGLEPGLLATVLSALGCAYFFLPPLYSLAVIGFNAVGLVQFVLVSLLISILNQMLRSAQQQAEINALEAQRNYDRLRQSQEKLHQSEQRYRLFVEGVKEYAIFMLDPNGLFINWNIGAERILGYQEAEIIGRHFRYIFTPDAIERGQPEQVLRTTVREGFSKENRWHIRKDGTHFWSYCVIIPLRDRDGNLRGFSKIMQDLTERKQAEEEREQLLLREQAARAEAEAANRSKDDFLAIVSHELRTPMTAILGWVGMLQTGRLDEAKAKDALETIERNANLQMQLIEDLLDISRIVQGNLSLNFGRVDLVEAIAQALEVVQPVADAKSIQIESALDTSVEPIWGDSDRLQQVVLNLLSNAIKFTPDGGRVEVRLSKGLGTRDWGLGREAEEQECESRSSFSPCPLPNAQIQVSDTGKGISPDFLPYVFERFRQADSTSTRSSKGLGLGLAIARHLVELHGGTISAQSQGIGQGATFTVKLPLTVVPSSEDAQTNNTDQIQPPTIAEDVAPLDNPPKLDGLRLLIVDDEADTRKWISTVLQECGAEVIAVGSTGEALASLEQFIPDVLVSDISMPDEDGYTLIRKIRGLEPEMGGRIPAVALTGYARVEDYRQAIEAGFQLHVAKPVRAVELVAVVASLGRMSGKI
ncbi:MAG: PAS domain S-box protein [Chlorogloeopsis fritschii C42_A2020_084]|uniref:ATP-binding response regulator n=1 Tax=Chlorogloeopsis fritschii TaxID=1124 RepID=UPI001A03EF68|nr:ATP-binding protein [Chlorogloeopsis fritschii]MBF2009477.1 PAS domain S-box protein [Chlorogloeopsis fritschii C42_A2020_084]